MKGRTGTHEPIPLGTCTVPDGESGDWRIDTFTITKDDAKLHNLRAMIGGAAWTGVVPGTYRRLSCKGRGVVMSNTPMEVRTNREAYNAATGRVLINGLGLGMLLEAVLDKPDVTYVRVIECEADVINLTWPHFERFRGRAEVVHADALTYKPAPGERFDYVWHDIWDTIGEDNLPSMAKLGRRYSKRVAERQGHWCRDIIRADVRKWG